MPLPRLSELLKTIMVPESQFEDMVRSTVGIELPPGPSASITSIMETFEETLPLPIELPALPTLGLPLPPLPFFGGGESSKEEGSKESNEVQTSAKPAQRITQPARPRPAVRRGKVY